MSMTTAQAMAEARSRSIDRLDAQLLLAAVLSRPRAWLLAHDDHVLDDRQTTSFQALLARRADGEPVAYILGQKEFHGLTLRVDKRVLVPRPDTETLVDWALDILRSELAQIATPQVIDLGTGSGAIALAVKNACPRARLTATDASEPALALACDNAARLGLDINGHLGHWWQGAHAGSFHLALSNPPYIAQGDAHLCALRHEPAMALASGPDGLDAIRDIVSDAPHHLLPGAWLLIEHGHDQAAAVQALLREAGFSKVRSQADLAGVLRCSGGRFATSVTSAA